MVKPAPGARVVPRPIAKTSKEAATDDFYNRCVRADRQQAAENLRAAKRGGQTSDAARTDRISSDQARTPTAARSDASAWDDIADSLNRERGLSRPANPLAALAASLTPTRE